MKSPACPSSLRQQKVHKMLEVKSKGFPSLSDFSKVDTKQPLTLLAIEIIDGCFDLKSIQIRSFIHSFIHQAPTMCQLPKCICGFIIRGQMNTSSQSNKFHI